MPKCYIKGCKKEDFSKPSVTFHSLPYSKPFLMQKWLASIGPKNIIQSKWTRICSRHFESSCFYPFGEIKRLKNDAIPSLFLFEQKKTPNTPKRQVPRRRRNLLREFNDSMVTSFERIRVEHNYYLTVDEETVRFYKQKSEMLQKRYMTSQKKIKVLQQKLNRQNKKIMSLTGTLTYLKKAKYLNPNNFCLLKNIVDDIPKAILKRYCNSKYKAGNSQKYSVELRKFSLTLNFLSPKGYNYVRKVFGNSLPHPVTLYKWYDTVNGNPGISEEALETIKSRIEIQGERPIVSLIFDEIAIRKHIDLSGDKNIGFVDFGFNMSNINENNLPPVAEFALVYVVASLNYGWKVPIAYFLIKNIKAEEKTNIIKTIIQKLLDIKVEIACVTCDGLSTNINVAKLLGVRFDISNFSTTMTKCNTSEKIQFILDPSHSLKLVRNMLFEYKILLDENGNEINVNYLTLLQELQDKEDLKLPNKLTSAHLSWEKQPMKVRLAAQTLSASVADSIDYCREILLLPQFQRSEATTRFIRFIDRLFDFSNSRNVSGKHFKSPLKQNNECFWKPFLEQAFKYLIQIRTKSGQLVIESRRKTGFLGFLTAIRGFQEIFNRFVTQKSNLKYLLTYKCSQDHLELFFSSIRCKGGFNNNPTAKQFIAAFKRLLIYHELEHIASNCLALDNCKILNVSSSNKTKCKMFESDEVDNQFDSLIEISEHDYASMSSTTISLYIDNIVEYISGFVVKKILENLSCPTCSSCLPSSGSSFSLINFKNRGGLVIPSEDVVKICLECEKNCKKLNLMSQPCSYGKLLTNLILITFRNLSRNIFKHINDHLLDCETFGVNHNFDLIRKIIEIYFKIRLHHINRKFNLQLKGQSIRQQLHKIVLFKHQ